MPNADRPFIRIDRRGRVLWLTIDRPEVRNALHPPASEELSRGWDALEADDDLRVAVITGTGERAFCAGDDLKWRDPRPPDQRRVVEGGGFGGLTHRRLGKPVIAAVNGPAVGGGFELVLACDLVVASETARFGLPEVSIGKVANAGGVQRLTRALPPARALAVILANDPLSAREAFDLGLVTRVVPAAELEPAAQDLAERVAAMPALAVAAALEIAHRSADLTLSDALRHQYPAVDRLFREGS